MLPRCSVPPLSATQLPCLSTNDVVSTLWCCVDNTCSIRLHCVRVFTHMPVGKQVKRAFEDFRTLCNDTQCHSRHIIGFCSRIKVDKCYPDNWAYHVNCCKWLKTVTGNADSSFVLCFKNQCIMQHTQPSFLPYALEKRKMEIKEGRFTRIWSNNKTSNNDTDLSSPNPKTN